MALPPVPSQAQRQLEQALSAGDDARHSVQTTAHRHSTRRPIAYRLTEEQVQELVAAFETGTATRMELAERYGIGRTIVAKLLREAR